MLQHWKLVGFIAAIVEQPFDELRLDSASCFFDRFADSLLEMAAGQIGNQILGGAH